MTAAGHEAAAEAGRLRGRLGTLATVPWLPVYLAILALFVASRWLVNPEFTSFDTFWTIVVLASFVAVVGAGQGFVILTGGIDLSVPWIITLGGILTIRWSNGENEALLWTLPAILAIGAGIGAVNGIGVARLGVSPVVFTIAMNSIVQSVVLVTTGGTPKGRDAPQLLRRAMHDDVGGVPVVVFLLLGFTVVVGLLMSKTTFGKRAYAVGNSQTVARLSGVRVWAVLVGVYAFSGLTAALTGVFLTGYTAQSFLGMGEPYLLPSIAAVVIGGASILGGRGHYVGTLGGAIFLSLLATVIEALSLSDAYEQIVFGSAILLAVLAVRERVTV